MFSDIQSLIFYLMIFAQFLLSLFLSLSAANSNDLAIPAVKSPALILEIIPYRYADSIRPAFISLYNPDQQKFHVLLTNNSEKPIRIWREWCSWGYFSLSFKIELADGKVLYPKKQRTAWDKNFPDSMEIPPHGHAVFEVNFTNDSSKLGYWSDSPLNLTTTPITFKMTALFSIQESPHTKEHKVWTGSIQSKCEEFTLYH